MGHPHQVGQGIEIRLKLVRREVTPLSLWWHTSKRRNFDKRCPVSSNSDVMVISPSYSFVITFFSPLLIHSVTVFYFVFLLHFLLQNFILLFAWRITSLVLFRFCNFSNNHLLSFLKSLFSLNLSILFSQLLIFGLHQWFFASNISQSTLSEILRLP